MSVLAHKPHLAPIVPRSALIWLTAAAAIAAAVVLAFVLFGGNDRSLTPSTATPSTLTQNRGDGIRFDGGPDEGTRGAAVTPALVRFDGGPEEGTRGAVHAPVVVRFDGGPEEGTRGR